MNAPMVSVPVEPTEAMLKAAHAAMLSDIPPDGESTYGPTISTHAIYRAYWAAMLSAAPAPQPVQGEAVQIAAPDHIADARKMVAAPGDVEQALKDLAEAIAAYDPERMAKCGNAVAAPGDVEQRARELLDAECIKRAPRSSALVSVSTALRAISAALRSQGQADVVDDAMVERGLEAAREASDARLPRYSVVRAILTAALAQQANKEQPPNG